MFCGKRGLLELDAERQARAHESTGFGRSLTTRPISTECVGSLEMGGGALPVSPTACSFRRHWRKAAPMMFLISKRFAFRGPLARFRSTRRYTGGDAEWSTCSQPCGIGIITAPPANSQACSLLAASFLRTAQKTSWSLRWPRRVPELAALAGEHQPNCVCSWGLAARRERVHWAPLAPLLSPGVRRRRRRPARTSAAVPRPPRRWAAAVVS
jgi:hypothetical protein